MVFDFNYTLVYPLDPNLHIVNIDANKTLFKQILNKLSRERTDIILNRMMSNKNQKLINSHLKDFLKKYENMNFIVCSSSLERNASAYLEILESYDIKIRNHYKLNNFKFTEYSTYLSGLPIYKDSIIVTNRQKKGNILLSFIRRLSKSPKLVIFIDNNPDKLDDVRTTLKLLNETNLFIIEYREYLNKPIRKVSSEEFKSYWNRIVGNAI